MVIARSKRRRLVGCLSVACLLVTAAATIAPAAPLDDQTCEQLKREIVQLEGIGARDNLGKGAAWGKANLRGAQLEQVKKLIEMDEAVAFRCPKPKPKVDPALQAKAKAKAGPKGAPKVQAAESGAAQDVAKSKPKPKPKPRPAPVAADGGQRPAQATTAAAPPKPRPAPQPKSSDAYVPPKAPPAQ